MLGTKNDSMFSTNEPLKAMRMHKPENITILFKAKECTLCCVHYTRNNSNRIPAPNSVKRLPRIRLNLALKGGEESLDRRCDSFSSFQTPTTTRQRPRQHAAPRATRA